MDYTGVNEQILERFKRLRSVGRLGHAYLFVGPGQAGKTQTALAVAQLVNCERPETAPCRMCASCRKIEHGNHPDIYILGKDDGEGIKIDDIRQMLSRVGLKAFEANTKVFILRQIETMTTEASNALLKTLEEPAKNTLMILTTSVPEALLDTIKSRCHQVPFFGMPLEQLARTLSSEGVDSECARTAAYYAQGCLGRARALVKQDVIKNKNTIITSLILRQPDDALLKELAADKEVAANAMRLCLGFMRDVVIIKSGGGQLELANPDLLNAAQQMARKPVMQLQGIISQIVEIKKLIDDNLNIKMSLNILAQRTQSA